MDFIASTATVLLPLCISLLTPISGTAVLVTLLFSAFSRRPLLLLLSLRSSGLLLYTATSPRLGAKCRNSKILRFPASVFRKMRRTGAMQISKAESQESTSKKANLFAERKKIIKLPNYSDGCGRVYPFKEFLSHPLGMESILNTRALQSFQSLDSNTYRCTLPKLQFLSFEVSPVLVLRVTTTSEDCTVEMLSCKFEGSKVFERQSENFSALMRNHITWDVTGHEPCLAVDVKLYVTLEVRYSTSFQRFSHVRSLCFPYLLLRPQEI
ncbi:DUF1997 family protein, putative (DUF1997) isoform X3 [Tasmannia lanceolata]|uniref:DUF1997 family protein, putative (DUF1997) isoform X3 n=1 Tax=Tasmannia lanceolata TaxID=3420 RepID=UPI004062EA4E